MPNSVVLGAVTSGKNKSNGISVLTEFTFCCEVTGNACKLEHCVGHTRIAVNRISVNVDSTCVSILTTIVKLGASATNKVYGLS